MSYGDGRPAQEFSTYAQRRMALGNRGRARAVDESSSYQLFAFTPGRQLDVAPIISTENLILAWNKCAREGGTAPGTDDLRYGDLGRSQVAAAMRLLSTAVEEGRYRPQRSRSVSISKPDGGTRTLRLRGLFDRVLSRAVTTAVAPLIDAALLSTSYGFRAQRGVADLIAELEVSVVRDGRRVIVDTDIRQAFDYVPIDAAVAALGRSLHAPSLLTLVETILRGHDGAVRRVGIDQGDALSPVTLINLLDVRLDRPLIAAHPEVRSYRFADNHVLAARSIDAAQEGLQTTRRLLADIGMTLKGDPQPVVLRSGVEVDILGYTVALKRNEGLDLGVNPRAWRRLREFLDLAVLHEHPHQYVARVVDGWCGNYGVCFETDAERHSIARQVVNAVRISANDAPSTERIVQALAETYAKRRRPHSE